MRFWWKNGFRLKVRKMGFNVQPVRSKKRKIYTFFAHPWTERRKKANKRQRDQIEFIFLAFFPFFSQWNKGKDKEGKNLTSPLPQHRRQSSDDFSLGCSLTCSGSFTLIYDFMTHTFILCKFLHLSSFYVIFM